MKNPFAQAPRPLQLTVEAPNDALDIMELLAEDTALAITRPIDTVIPQLVLLVGAEGAAAMKTMIAKVAQQQKVTPNLHETQLADIDWVRQVQKDFPPFSLGPFYVYGSYAKGTIPRNKHPLLIDAAAAFGTGEHATTAGCLLALAEEKRVRPHLRSALDIGCGTAILAIGIARLWKDARITASDNDPIAVEVSRENLAANRVRYIQAVVSDGYKSAAVKEQGPYELIVANILARPLMKLSRDAARALAPGGTLILSGLLNDQEAMVLSAHRMQGLYLKKRIRRGRWSVLVLSKR